MSKTDNTRRRFIKTLAAGTGAALSMPALSYGKILGANERIRVGMIGIGQQSRGHLRNLMSLPEAEVVALCDVYQPNLDFAARMAPEAKTYKDYRQVIELQDVDAVVIGTPDHWHAIPTVHACEAGKDVYVEKPISVRIEEGRRMVEAARRYNRVVQVGTQQRSADHFRESSEIVRSGKLGKISFIRTWNTGNEYPEGIGNPPDSNPPPDLDWEMWLGPAPQRPFNINRFGVILNERGHFTRWASFRWFWDYAGGWMTDWGIHLLDIVQWAMDVEYPEYVTAVGGKLGLQDNSETPDTLLVSYQYPGFVATYERRSLNAFPFEGKGYGIMYYGTSGTMFVDREGYEIFPERGSSLEAVKVRATDNSGLKHMRNFLESIKTREKPICDIEIGHRSSSTAILGNIAYRTGRTIRWDGANETPIGDEEAKQMLAVQERGQWKF